MLRKWFYKKVTQEIINLFLNKDLYLISTHFKNYNEKLVCMDKNGYKYVISIGKLKCGRKPKAFNEFNPYALENLHLYFHKHNLNSKIIVNIDKFSYKTTITFECECGKVFNKKLSDIFKNKTCRCKQCKYNVIVDKTKLDFNIIKNKIETNSKLIVLSNENNYLNQSSKILLKCECGNIFDSAYRKLRENKFQTKCRLCRTNSTIQKRHNDATNKFMKFISDSNDYELIKYIDSRSYATLKCKHCGCFFEIVPHSLYAGTGCKCQSRSKGEKIITKLLEEKNINFKHEFIFSDCKSPKKFPLRFDFYIPDCNTCIEFDGQFHYAETDLRKSDLNYQLKCDDIKNKYCLDNNINIIRIPYWEIDNIEKILKDYNIL